MPDIRRLRSKKGGAIQSVVAYTLSIAAAMSSAAFPAAAIAYADRHSEPVYTVTITADGEVRTFRAGDMAVGELLTRENYTIGAYDELNVAEDAPISDNMVIQIDRVEYAFREKSEFIAYETETRGCPEMKIGDCRTVSEGVDGDLTIKIKDKYVNGELKSSEVIQTVTTEPLNEVVEYGTALADPISKREGDYTLENGIPAEYEFVLDGKVTAYTAPRNVNGTYSGRPLVIGSVAVDPDIIPFGSELYIVSKDGTHVYGYAIASDTGYLTQANVLADVYMGTTEDNFGDACNWGAQFCNVYVLSVGDNSVSWR